LALEIAGTGMQAYAVRGAQESLSARNSARHSSLKVRSGSIARLRQRLH
jgi:hypothetical protein